MKKTLIRIHWFFSAQLGLNPLLFLRWLKNISGYVADWRMFRKNFDGEMRFLPCLHDKDQGNGLVNNEYFWQDLMVARWIFENNPVKHVDIGSRVDGFVAHVASYRDIELFDIRPMDQEIPGIIFREADIMDPAFVNKFPEGYCDSLSCLHALEHFGLGRYGDPIDPEGFRKGLENMGRLVKQGGRFYLATPVGRERVDFNANWIFDPRRIMSILESLDFTCEQLFSFGSSGMYSHAVEDAELNNLAIADYHLGIFIFSKNHNSATPTS